MLCTAILLYFVIHRHMARLMEAEEAVRKSEAQYREVVENGGSIILRTDPQGNVTFINGFGLRFFGFSRDELLGRNVLDVIIPPKECWSGLNFADKFDAISPKTNCHGKIVSENILRNGERVWVAWNHMPICKDGRVEEILNVGIDITDQKDAEERLKRANLLLHSQKEAFIDGIVSIDENGLIISSNRLFATMWGLCEEAASEGVNSLPALTSMAEKVVGSQEFFQRIVCDQRENDKTTLAEIELKDARVFETYTAPMIASDGGFHGHTLHFRDITARKVIERTAAETEAKYRDIFENSVTGIYQVTPDGRCLTVNNTIAHMLGYDSPSELLARTNNQAERLYAKPEQRRNLLKVIEEQGMAREFVVELLGKEKNIVWTCIDVRAVRGSDGKIRYLEGTLRDVTRQKLMEDAVASAEAKYKHIFENSIVGIFHISREGYFLSLNQAMARNLGYESPEEALAALGNVETLFVDKQRRAVLLELIKKHGLVEQFEVEFFRQNHSVMWASLNINAFRGADARISFFYGTMQDITDRKLLQAQLDQAQRMEAIGTLAGGIAHDFNNILTPIIGYAELSLLSMPEDTKLARNMRQVLLSANRAKDLIKRILTFGRKTEHKPRVVQVSLIIGEVLDLLRSSLPSTIEIRQSVQPDAADRTILAEPTQIHQVLMNLCTNAAHAMRSKGGTLTVSLACLQNGELSEIAAPDLKPGPHLRLTVTDTGHGMDEAVKERIFDPYFTTKGSDVGTGLGLAVVYGIVKNLAGAITVSSLPGQGAAFDVFFPIAGTAETVSLDLSAPLDVASGLVLLVDDEKAIVDMNREMLEKMGYEVVTAQNGAEGLQTFKSNPHGFDAVITDMTMPKMTGADLAGEILAIRGDIPIILCTGFSDNFDEQKARALGIKAYLTKPVPMRDLALALRKITAKTNDPN
ncbi:MAG: PAS domain-containing hybrid sensor histidine kinase/response regulator [Syntrophobacteraceae bacterium]